MENQELFTHKTANIGTWMKVWASIHTFLLLLKATESLSQHIYNQKCTTPKEA